MLYLRDVKGSLIEFLLMFDPFDPEVRRVYRETGLEIRPMAHEIVSCYPWEVDWTADHSPAGDWI